MPTKKFKRKEAHMTNDDQLNLWAEGVSVHNLNSGSDRIKGGECTPDFSCCKPALKALKSVRLRFLRGNQKVRNQILGDFLTKLIETSTKRKVYLVR